MGRVGRRERGWEKVWFTILVWGRKCSYEMATSSRNESEGLIPGSFLNPSFRKQGAEQEALWWAPALKAFHGERVVERVGVTIFFLQEQLVDGQGTDGSPGVLGVRKDWLGDGDRELDKLGPRQGWGWRLVLQGGGGQRGQRLRPREVGEGSLVLGALQRGPHGGRSGTPRL